MLYVSMFSWSSTKPGWTAVQELFPEHLLLGGRLSREKGALQATVKGWFGRKGSAALPEQAPPSTSALEVTCSLTSVLCYSGNLRGLCQARWQLAPG